MAVPWGSLTLLSFHSLCLNLRSHLTKWKYSKPTQDVFKKKQPEKEQVRWQNGRPKASVHPVRNRLCYNFFLYETNESCSQSVSRRRMLLRRFNKFCLQVTAPNATEPVRPFYERSRMVLHVTRRLLLQPLASVLSSHVRFQILDSSYHFNLCRWYYWGQGNWIAS